MPLLKFEVQADYEKVIKLREEITRLEDRLKSFDATTPVEAVRKVEHELAAAKSSFQSLTTAAIAAGAEIEDGFKKKIYDASTVVNDFTSKIIEQKENVRLATVTVREFADKYKEALKGGQPGEASYYKKMLQDAKDALEQERSAMFELTQEQAKARLSVKSLTDEYKLLKKEVGDNTDVIDELSQRLTSMGRNILGIIGAGAGIKEFISNMVSTRGEFQQIETSLEVLLGSEEKAVRLMDEVKEFAKVSPLDLKSTAAATQMMLGFNIEVEKVPRYLQAIGDISMGDAQRFNSLTLAFSQMSATGKLMGQDLNQMINAGFNPLQIMADKSGKSIATLKEEMSKGAISAAMVQQAFIDATDAGGKFYQMSEKASQTINGQISMLQDALDAMFNDMGETSEEVILGTIGAATTLVENYETVGAILLGLIATYGTYRAAVLVNIALTEGWAAAASKDAIAKGIQTTATKAATVAQAAYNAVARANPYVLLATAVAAAASAIFVYSTRATDAENAQKRLNKAVADADAAFASEQTNIDLLFNKLKNAKEGTEEYASAQKSIIDQYGEYLSGLVDEKNKLLDVEAAYQRVTVAARESANARAMEEYNKEASDRYSDSYRDVITGISEEINKRVKNKNLQDTLLRLVREDISSGDGLSEATMASLSDAFKETNRSDASGVGRIRKLVNKERSEKAIYDRAKESAESQFGSQKNEFENFNLQQLEKMKSDLVYQTKGIKTTKELQDVYLSFADGTVKEFNNLGELQSTMRKIEDAISKQQKEAQTKKDNNYGTQYGKAKKEWEDAKAELKKIEADKNNYSKEQFEAAKQREASASAAFKKLNGDTTGKTAKAGEKKQNSRNRLDRELLDFEAKNQSAQTELMEDGRKKREVIIEQEYEDRIQAIRKQKEDWAAENKKTSMPDVNKDGLTTAQSDAINDAEKLAAEKRNKETQDLYKEDLAAMRDYLKEYGTFQQQKLAITEEYAEKIRLAQTEGERLTLEKQRDAAIRQVDVDAINQQIDWQSVFGGFTGALEEQLRETLSGLKDYTKTDKFRNSSVEDKKLVYEAIERIQQQLPGMHDGTLNFGKLKEQMDALGKAINEAQAAAKADVAAQDHLTAAKKEYEEAVRSGETAAIAAAKTQLALAEDVANGTAATLVAANDKVENLGADLQNSSKSTVDGLNLVADGLQGFASGTLPGVFSGLQNTLTGLSKIDLGDSLNKAVGKLSNTLSSAGTIGQIIGAVLSILDILKDGIGTLVASLIDTVLSAVNGILDNILSGDFAVQIGKSLRDGIGGILNTITFGGLNSWLSSSNAKEVAETTNRLTARNEILCQSIDSLKDEMAKARGLKTVQAYDKAYKAQEELIKNTGSVLSAQMSYHGSHHSNSYYIDKAMTDADWKQVTALVGQKVASAGELWQLTPEQLKKLQGDPELWTKIYTSGKYDKTEYLDQYLDLVGTLDELTEDLKETLTQISFDSVYDSFVDTLMDMDMKAEDVAANVSEYFMRAMLSNKIGEAYSDRLEAWYDSFAGKMKDGGLSSSDIKSLNDEYMAMVNEAMVIRDQLAAATGYDKTASSYQQGSTAGYSTQFSEDTGSEIVGRLTAAVDVLYRIEELDIDRNDLLRNINPTQNLDYLTIANLTNTCIQELLKVETDSYMVHVDNRRILVESYLELQQIRENTGAIIKPINSMTESLKNIEKNTKEMI